MRVSLIIPAHNEEKYVGACLDSVRAHADFDEVIVVDNASTDKTTAVASSRLGVKVVPEHTKGLPAARERGRIEATGDLIAYIDADSRMHEKWLPMAKKIFEERPDVVSLSGPARYWDGTFMQRAVMKIFWWISAPLTYRIVGYMLFGAHFIVRREALEKIGGFNKSITFYGEDTDLAKRLSKHGKVMFKMNFYIYTSARRFKKEGMIKANLRYAMNFLWPVLFHRPFSKTHKDIREA